MFQNPKYITKGIHAEILPEHIMLMWLMIEEVREHTPLDYLQIFMLSPISVKDRLAQQIVHHQERPEYCKTAIVSCDKPIHAKIFCIDDQTHSTMLLTNEY